MGLEGSPSKLGSWPALRFLPCFWFKRTSKKFWLQLLFWTAGVLSEYLDCSSRSPPLGVAGLGEGSAGSHLAVFVFVSISSSKDARVGPRSARARSCVLLLRISVRDWLQFCWYCLQELHEAEASASSPAARGSVPAAPGQPFPFVFAKRRLNRAWGNRL